MRLQDIWAEIAEHSLALHADWPLPALLRKKFT